MFIELCSDACQTCSEMETTLNVSKAFKRIDMCSFYQCNSEYQIDALYEQSEAWTHLLV